MTIDKIYLESNTRILTELCKLIDCDSNVTRTTDETINYNVVNISGIAPKYENDFKMSYYHLARISNKF